MEGKEWREVHREAEGEERREGFGWVGELERRSRNSVRKKGEVRCTGEWD